MKILQIIQKPQLRGAEIFASQLSRQLQAQGCEVLLMSLFQGEGQLDFKGKHINLGLSGTLRWVDLYGFKAIADVVKREKPDLIQANAGDTLKYAVLSRLCFGWKQPIIFRNASIVSLYIKNPLIKKLNGFLYKKVDAIASVSQQSKRDLNLLFPITTGKSQVISIGIDTQRMEEEMNIKPSDMDPLNDKLELQPIQKTSPIKLVHVGGFSFEKNHKGLLKIFRAFIKDYPNAKLHLIGDGPLKEEVEQFTKELQLTESVCFFGYQSNPQPFIKEADVFVLPSVIEGLPGVVLEAFYSKTPVVAYNVGGVSEVVKNDTTGILVNKNSEEEFVQAIKETLQHREQTQVRVRNAYEFVKREFRNDVIAKKFSAYYKEILGYKDDKQT